MHTSKNNMNVFWVESDHSIKIQATIPRECPWEWVCENAEKSHSAPPSRSLNIGSIELKMTPFNQEWLDLVNAIEITDHWVQNVWKLHFRNFTGIHIFIDFGISNHQKVVVLQYRHPVDMTVELERREMPWSRSLAVARMKNSDLWLKTWRAVTKRPLMTMNLSRWFSLGIHWRSTTPLLSVSSIINSCIRDEMPLFLCLRQTFQFQIKQTDLVKCYTDFYLFLDGEFLKISGPLIRLTG